jgi:hypothetical protein
VSPNGSSTQEILVPSRSRRAFLPALFSLPFPFLVTLAPALLAQAPQSAVIPASCAATDGNSYLWAAVGRRPVSMQTLIGPSHLQALLGKELLALSLRRHAADETYAGTMLAVQVRLAHSPRTPLTVSRLPADNLGANAMLAFDGQLALPTSPPAPGPQVAWSPANTLAIPLVSAANGHVPFVYTGGTLCIDITSHELPGQPGTWWMADAVEEDLEGSATPLGSSCGRYGGSESHRVATRSLIPGSYAEFTADGTPGGIGLFALGLPAPPLPMSQFGLPANCFLHLDPASAFIAAIEPFEPLPAGLLPWRGGQAEAQIKLPAVNQILGTAITAQWFDVSDGSMSNAATAVIGGAVPLLDLANVQTYAGTSRGSVRVDLSYVLRFEFRDPQ